MKMEGTGTARSATFHRVLLERADLADGDGPTHPGVRFWRLKLPGHRAGSPVIAWHDLALTGVLPTWPALCSPPKSRQAIRVVWHRGLGRYLYESDTTAPDLSWLAEMRQRHGTDVLPRRDRVGIRVLPSGLRVLPLGDEAPGVYWNESTPRRIGLAFPERRLKLHEYQGSLVVLVWVGRSLRGVASATRVEA